jgi:hypothetical protein
MIGPSSYWASIWSHSRSVTGIGGSFRAMGTALRRSVISHLSTLAQHLVARIWCVYELFAGGTHARYGHDDGAVGALRSSGLRASAPDGWVTRASVGAGLRARSDARGSSLARTCSSGVLGSTLLLLGPAGP